MRVATTTSSLVFLGAFAAWAAACLTTLKRQNPLVHDSKAKMYLIETAPGQTHWTSEEGKWELIRARTPPSYSPHRSPQIKEDTQTNEL